MGKFELDGFNYVRVRIIRYLRIHTGCDLRRAYSTQRYLVSIHAPTRGATSCSTLDSARRNVSIHAPTRGATPNRVHGELKDMFQSTHPHGVRPEELLQFGWEHAVSIHAPTRGATWTMQKSTMGRLFQSTHPHGVRHVVGQTYFA